MGIILLHQSDMIVKRMERTKRIGTDFDSPSARPSPPQAEKIRFCPFHPFYNHVAFSKQKRSKVRRQPGLIKIQQLSQFTNQINP